MTFKWEVQYSVERRWLRWRVHAVYSLISNESMSYCLIQDKPGRYWLKSSAELELQILKLHTQYGQPQTYKRWSNQNA